MPDINNSNQAKKYKRSQITFILFYPAKNCIWIKYFTKNNNLRCPLIIKAC